MSNIIPHKSMIMRCDHIEKTAFQAVPNEISVCYYEPGMAQDWIDVQRKAGEFSDQSDEEVMDYFMDRFGNREEELAKRCFFLKDPVTGALIGTCMAWTAMKEGQVIPILHWLAVDQDYAGKGYARVLITLVMEKFQEISPNEPVYLHTQPKSFAAIKLYMDFGFILPKTDTYGTAVNENEEGIAILQEYVREDVYQRMLACCR